MSSLIILTYCPTRLTDRLTDRVAGRQADSRFVLYELLLWDTHTNTHTSRDIQTCHWTGLPLSWEDCYPLISTHKHTNMHAQAHVHTHMRTRTHTASKWFTGQANKNVCECMCVFVHVCVLRSLWWQGLGTLDSLSLSAKSQPAKIHTHTQMHKRTSRSGHTVQSAALDLVLAAAHIWHHKTFYRTKFNQVVDSVGHKQII